MRISVSPRSRRWGVVATGLFMAVTATACSSGNSRATGTPVAKASGRKIVVVSGPLADPFFSAMKKGTEQAGKDYGVDVRWTAAKDLSNPAGDYARLGDAAAEAHPDGLVLSYFLPPAQEKSLKQVIAAKTPVVFMNAGSDWQDLGGLNFVGENPAVVGKQVAEQFVDEGKKHIMCFNHVPGVPAVQQRCDAMKEALVGTGTKFTQVEVPISDGQNPTAITTAIAGALRADKTIDAIFTLGTTSAERAAAAAEKAGRPVSVITTDISTNVLNLIKAGKIERASDQQPYLTGYLSVQILAQYLQYGVHPIGAVDTAPNWITKDNADQVLKINAESKGIRGAA